MSEGKRQADRGRRSAEGGGARGTKRKKTGGGALHIALIALGCVAAAVLLVVGIWKSLVVAPDVGGPDPGSAQPGGEGQTGEILEELPGAETDPARKENYFTFLLLGKDTGGGENTDTMLLVSYDASAQNLNCLTIPRDTMINVPWNIKKINAVYASSRGVEGLKEEIGKLTGIIPDFYIAVEWEAIGEIVDALGGVWFDVPYHMDYDDPYQDLHIHQEKGYRLLDGSDAMQVIRWRSNNNDSPHGYHREDGGIGDTGRQQVQKSFLKALAAQCLQLKNWTKVSEFANIFFHNVETDIPLNNLLWFAQTAMGLDAQGIAFHTLPGNDQGWYYTPSIRENLAYFFAEAEGIVPLVNQYFNPYTRLITEEDLQIMYKKKDASLGVTNGELADPDMAIPSVKPKQPAADEEDEAGEEEIAGEIGEEPSGGESGASGETAPPESGLEGEEDTPPEGTGAQESRPPQEGAAEDGSAGTGGADEDLTPPADSGAEAPGPDDTSGLPTGERTDDDGSI